MEIILDNYIRLCNFAET